jgi:hypothetical protein
VRMMQAKNVADFREALKLRGMSMWNYVYADVDGNIGYQYNAFVPHRDASIDWAKPVAGDDPKSKWGELWSLDDLPHIDNPKSGILVNCNSSPTLTPMGNDISGTWPSDVTTYGPTSRWEVLSGLLLSQKRISPERAQEIATDCSVPYAAETIAQLSPIRSVARCIRIGYVKPRKTQACRSRRSPARLGQTSRAPAQRHRWKLPRSG